MNNAYFLLLLWRQLSFPFALWQNLKMRLHGLLLSWLKDALPLLLPFECPVPGREQLAVELLAEVPRGESATGLHLPFLQQDLRASTATSREASCAAAAKRVAIENPSFSSMVH